MRWRLEYSSLETRDTRVRVSPRCALLSFLEFCNIYILRYAMADAQCDMLSCTSFLRLVVAGEWIIFNHFPLNLCRLL